MTCQGEKVRELNEQMNRSYRGPHEGNIHSIRSLTAKTAGKLVNLIEAV